jgi:hypothetical protein
MKPYEPIRFVHSSIFCKKNLSKHTSHILITILEGLDRTSIFHDCIQTISRTYIRMMSLSWQKAFDKSQTQKNVSKLVGLYRENAPRHQYLFDYQVYIVLCVGLNEWNVFYPIWVQYYTSYPSINLQSM